MLLYCHCEESRFLSGRSNLNGEITALPPVARNDGELKVIAGTAHQMTKRIEGVKYLNEKSHSFRHSR
jgi:hypothetical protein